MTAFPCACCRSCRYCAADDRLRAMQRVYGRGYHDGLEAGGTESVPASPLPSPSPTGTGEKTMTPARQRAALQGQSAVAMKVYEAVPISEAWEPHKILAAVTAVHRTQLDRHVLDGCLNRLLNSCLIRQDDKGRWQRVKVRDHEGQEKASMTNGNATDKTTLTLAHPADRPGEADRPVQTPLETLGGIATRLREASALLASVAGDLETVALGFAESAVDPEELARLRQLRALLKTL